MSAGTRAQDAVRYPKRFEVFRLEAMGEDPYYSDDEATARYATGRALTVVPATDPVGWRLHIASSTYPFGGDTYRFTVTFHGAGNAHVRTVTWETVDGELFRRQIVDNFHPAADPRTGAPRTPALRVSQQQYTDGVRLVTWWSSDDDAEHSVEVGGLPVDARRAIPAFGDWAEIVRASAPTGTARFGSAARSAAEELFAAAVRGAGPAAPGRWRTPASPAEVVDAVWAILRFAPVPAGVPMLDRGPAKILPLAVQGTAAGAPGLDPAEEARRMSWLGARISDAFEHAGGRPAALDLERPGDDRIAAYTRSLRAAGAVSASWWVFDAMGVVVVSSGTAEAGELSLAVQVVPASWVVDRLTRPGGEPVDLRWTRADLPTAPPEGEAHGDG